MGSEYLYFFCDPLHFNFRGTVTGGIKMVFQKQGFPDQRVMISIQVNWFYFNTFHPRIHPAEESFQIVAK